MQKYSNYISQSESWNGGSWELYQCPQLIVQFSCKVWFASVIKILYWKINNIAESSCATYNVKLILFTSCSCQYYHSITMWLILTYVPDCFTLVYTCIQCIQWRFKWPLKPWKCLISINDQFNAMALWLRKNKKQMSLVCWKVRFSNPRFKALK